MWYGWEMFELNENDKRMNSIIDEYKMSMGGCFFNKTQKKDYDV